MEFTQMTLDQWATLKDQLKQDIIDAREKFDGIKRDFVRIGYKLRKIEEMRLFEKDGYKTITEFAEAECGLTKYDVSRFMSINERYSVDGYSEELREEFLQYGSSKLAEMLALPEHDMQMLQPEVSREGIRELKRFNKTEPEKGEADDVRELIEKFFKDNKEILNRLFADPAIENYEENTKRLSEIVNPSGNRTVRKGLFMMMMYENRIVVKEFRGTPRDMTWEEFLRITMDIFGESAAGRKTWEAHFGEGAGENSGDGIQEDAEKGGNQDAGKDRRTDQGRTGERQERNDGGSSQSDEGKDEAEGGSSQAISAHAAETEEEKVAPAQKVETDSVRTECEEVLEEQKEEPKQDVVNQSEEQIPGQMEVNDYPELLPELDKPFGSRKQYIDTLTEYGAAQYFAELFRNRKGPSNQLFPKTWEDWFMEEVDDKGRAIEVVEEE